MQTKKYPVSEERGIFGHMDPGVLSSIANRGIRAHRMIRCR